MGFLSNYQPWQFWTATKGCNKISKKKKEQKTCKNVVKYVLKDKKNAVDACKDRGWCPASPPTSAPTCTPSPDEEECADCPGFLSNFKKWQSWAAQKIVRMLVTTRTCKTPVRRWPRMF